MAKAKRTASAVATISGQAKVQVTPFGDERKREIVVQYMDDVVAKLTASFFEVVSKEKWGKRDLSTISGLNETAIGHILSGRRKNLTVETIALLARAMRKRPELVLHDTRPAGNHFETLSSAAEALESYRLPSSMPSVSAASALQNEQWQQHSPSGGRAAEKIVQGVDQPAEA